ncbi:MAG TPA: hypothetical protein VHN11_04100, partial [Xanthobacteraceae bacterium]|nr:hypothetical protein [Xanthobacteraceae bacterium]
MLARLTVFSTIIASLLGASPIHARVTELRIDAVEPFADGQAFGDIGPYVRIRGIAKGELDPNAPENSIIVNIDKAPRNERGLVTYETDVFILRPADPGKGSKVMLYDVLNRGRKFVLNWIDDAPANNDPKTGRDAGLGFSLGRGYTIVWSGWDPDVPLANNGMAARLPIATNDGTPIIKRIRDEIQIGTRGPANVDVARLSYPAAGTDKAKARLTVRDREADAGIEVPSDGWEFADAQSIRLLPAGTK